MATLEKVSCAYCKCVVTLKNLDAHTKRAHPDKPMKYSSAASFDIRSFASKDNEKEMDVSENKRVMEKSTTVSFELPAKFLYSPIICPLL